MSSDEELVVVWWGIDADELEERIWMQFQTIEFFKDATFIEARSRAEYDKISEQLKIDGWSMGRTGSGAFFRMTWWSRKR